ncbi:MAG: D-alanyl-D-alanine carboxypeptidase/D-alanyl-D-alanine-endopeptidase [Gemmatimonadetes bacterium]|nr:D-alanyl-D-alanine carboxypeptidase/D-alanyl-D-alanine-endopeptidase [Gemmatimonadota bacterium]MYB62149.1 D-alanyl-D-alanine carboxypeptidase/D-alanyl-D-alanine-endopeptidase [Gemmatimonadota bacterium]
MRAKPTLGAAVFPTADAMKALTAPATVILLPVLALLVLACGGPLQFRGGPSGAERRLAEDISRVLDHPDLAPMTVGVKVVSPVTGRVLFARHSNGLFHPASNTKLFTAMGVLRTMGPDYRYLTSVFADGDAFAGSDTLHTSLYLLGRGDPMLESAHLDSLAGVVAGLVSGSYGARVIAGDIVVDDAYLDEVPYGEGWMWDDVQYSYSASLNALSVNGNSVKIGISPGAAVGAPVTVRVDPPTTSVTFIVEALTAAAGDTSTAEPLRIERDWPSRSNQITITGRVAMDAGERTYFRSVEAPGLYAGKLFRDKLQARGVRVTGPVRRGVTPTRARTVATYRSPPVTGALARLLKYSHNLTAELLIKTMGRHTTGEPGSSADGLAALRQVLADYIGLDPDAYRFADGSGLSWYNYVSPDQVAALLTAAYHDPLIGADFREALPVAGEDGTLANRMKDTAAMGNLRAKTGTLTGVSCLSGYVHTRDGEPLVFSIMINNFVGPASTARRAQDAIGVLLAGFSRK